MSTMTLPALTVNPNRNRYGLRAPRGGCRVNGRFYRGGCFCPPYDESNPLELPTVELSGVSYLVEAVHTDNTPSAVRLTKRVSGEVHVVERHADGHASCDCLGFRYRGVCKHQAMAPTVAPAPSTVVEVIVTPSEVVSTRTTSPRPADVREMASWLAMAPAPALVPAHERPVSPYVAGQILADQEHRVRRVACQVVERHREIHESGPAGPGMIEMAAGVAWRAMDAEDREGFVEWCSSIGYQPDPLGDCPTDPADMWAYFISECRDGAPVVLPEPSDPGPGFTPSPEEEAEAAALLWEDEADDPDYHAWLDDLARDREEEAFAYAGVDGPRETDLYPPSAWS